jgi:Ca2+-binding EF-hand superfamily protein
VLLREREGAADQQKEEAYRRENYQIFRKNLQEAFNQYNVNGDQYLSKEEFKKFMTDKAKITGQDVSDELLEQIYLEMDVDKNGMIDC